MENHSSVLIRMNHIIVFHMIRKIVEPISIGVLISDFTHVYKIMEDERIEDIDSKIKVSILELSADI